ncbi:MAG: HAMP domain-containing histidine kinase [Proteobacteria bacterium]|nr:HAMP domain-containing histidine kinase [Pseudomonadota bacterium]MCP4919328.1 HAMP domain-containing histidine kinase [Pseudomonadota bacterium]
MPPTLQPQEPPAHELSGLSMVLPLRTWLLFSHMAVLTLPIFAVLATGALAYDLNMQTKGELINQSALVRLLVVSELEHAREDDPQADIRDIAWRLAPLLHQARRETLAAFRVIDTNGVVVATSGEGLGRDLSGQAEVAAALEGLSGTQVRPREANRSSPLSGPSRRAPVRVFHTTPVVFDGEQVAVILLSRTPREEVQALYQMSPRLVWGGIACVLLTMALSWRWATLGSRSLKRLAEAAARVSEGDLEQVENLEHIHETHVAEVGEVARSFARTGQQLRERLSYISEFAGNVSHEFKTPIATLRGTIELLADDEEMPPEQRERFLSNANAELERLERLVTGLLRLARAEEATVREDIDLGVLMSDLGERFPDLEVSGEAGEIIGNPAQVGSCVSNLVENAYAHGGEDVNVVLRGWALGERTGVEVEDDGPGISDANQKRIFERFFTTGRKRGGTGLGLALVQTIARSHGGAVEVQSRSGRTVFRVSFPRRPVA